MQFWIIRIVAVIQSNSPSAWKIAESFGGNRPVRLRLFRGFVRISPLRHIEQQINTEGLVMLEVYLDPATINSRKVLAGLELVGMPYHVNHVNYFAGAHKQSPYTDLNPNGVLPAAKDGES